jgi:hypothetical protein
VAAVPSGLSLTPLRIIIIRLSLFIAVSVSQSVTTYDFHDSGSLYTRYFIVTPLCSSSCVFSLPAFSKLLVPQHSASHLHTLQHSSAFISGCSLSKSRNFFHSRSHSRSFIWIFGHPWPLAVSGTIWKGRSLYVLEQWGGARRPHGAEAPFHAQLSCQ